MAQKLISLQDEKFEEFKPVSVLKGGIQCCVYGRGNVRSPWTLGGYLSDICMSGTQKGHSGIGTIYII